MDTVATEDFKELVIARIQSMPDGTTISIGGTDTVTKEDALKHIRSDDQIGKQMLEIEKAFFDLLKSGDIYKFDEE